MDFRITWELSKIQMLGVMPCTNEIRTSGGESQALGFLLQEIYGMRTSDLQELSDIPSVFKILEFAFEILSCLFSVSFRQDITCLRSREGWQSPFCFDGGGGGLLVRPLLRGLPGFCREAPSSPCPRHDRQRDCSHGVNPFKRKS